MGDLLRRIADDGPDLAGVLVEVDKGFTVDSVGSLPSNREGRIRLLDLHGQGIPIAGDRLGKLIGGVQQSRIPSFGGKQQQLADHDDPLVVVGSTTLDVADFIGQTEGLSLYPLFSWSTLDPEPTHFFCS